MHLYTLQKCEYKAHLNLRIQNTVSLLDFFFFQKEFCFLLYKCMGVKNKVMEDSAIHNVRFNTPSLAGDQTYFTIQGICPWNPRQTLRGEWSSPQVWPLPLLSTPRARKCQSCHPPRVKRTKRNLDNLPHHSRRL